MTVSTQLFPEIVDGSTLNARVTSGVFLPIGVEGQSDSAGSVAINVTKLVTRNSEADDFFGPVSSLSTLVKYLLDRGAGPVYAIASKKGSFPSLADRQVSWQALEANTKVRIRLTDTSVQANLVALAVSCDNANLLNNKQFAIAGMPAATSKAALITAAAAVASKRLCLVGPAIYNQLGTLLSGVYTAASIAALVALNSDAADDLDTLTIPLASGMELDASGNDVFRRLVVSGVVVNDFEDLLQAGVSPIMPGINGGVAISHLRTTYTTDTTFDALMTRVIMDQLFVLVRDKALKFNALRKGNTKTNRDQLASSVDALLNTLGDLVQPVEQPDGTDGYGVRVDASVDNRQQIISYQAEIVRGTSTVLVAPSFTIAV